MTEIENKIVKEKSQFIQKHSAFFYNIVNKYKENVEISKNEKFGFYYLKKILLSNSPLIDCPEYNDLSEIIKESSIKNSNSNSYFYSITVLHFILKDINELVDCSDKQADNRDVIRRYQRCLNDSDSILTDISELVNIDDDKLQKILKKESR